MANIRETEGHGYLPIGPANPEVSIKDVNKVYIVGKGRDIESLEYFNTLRSLYGCPNIRIKPDGDILYLTWSQVDREDVNPDAYHLLSGTRVREDIYLSWGLTSKTLYETRVNLVSAEGGRVEAAIRAMDHIIDGMYDREGPQAQTIRRRINELFELYLDFPQLTEEQFKQIERETYRQLASVGFNPDKVLLEEKRRMGGWIIKGSKGQDSLQRRNWLITMMALEAAQRRAIQRTYSIGATVAKFVEMREVLSFERAFCREIFSEVGHWLREEAMPNHDLFKNYIKYIDMDPRELPNVNMVLGILNTRCNQLRWPRVRNYKTEALKAREILLEIIHLLRQNKIKEIKDRCLFEEARNIVADALVAGENIYP